MTAAPALARARAAGLTLTAEDGRLRWRGPQPPADLLAELRQHKADLLRLLAVNDAAPLLPPASPEQAEAEQQDRAAIEAVDAGGEPARWRLADHMAHAARLRGLQATASARPPSWPDPDAVPSPGCWCSCCRGAHWWREREAPSGWRCRTCHPPVHLPPGEIIQATFPLIFPVLPDAKS